MKDKHLKCLFWIVIAIGLIQGLYYAYNVVLTPDQGQMIERGIKLSELGIWTHTGNNVTGGGNVPGSLTAAIVGFPLMLWDHAMAPQIFISLLQLICLLLINEVLKDSFSLRQRLVFVALFWLSPWRASKAILWNPSYLFFATGLHLFTAHRLQKQPKHFLWSFLHVISIGFAFQLHASSIILAMISGYLILRKKLQVSWWGISSAVILVVLSLVPFLIEATSQKSIIPVVDEKKTGGFHYFYGVVKVYPLIKGILYWPRYSSMVFPSYIFKNLDYSWAGSGALYVFVKYSLVIARNVFGWGSFLLSFWGFTWMIKRFWQNRRQAFEMGSFLDNYIFSTFAAMLVAIIIMPSEPSHWHLFLILPITYVSLCQFLFSRFSHWSFGRGFFAVSLTCTWMLIYNVVAVKSAKTYFSTEKNMVIEYEAVKSGIKARYPEEAK